MFETVDRLLREQHTEVLREKRAAGKHPFVRPVRIQLVSGAHEDVKAFTKDISANGVTIVTSRSWPVGVAAALEIHSLQGPDFQLQGSVHWCESFGHGWYVSGWHFVE